MDAGSDPELWLTMLRWVLWVMLFGMAILAYLCIRYKIRNWDIKWVKDIDGTANMSMKGIEDVSMLRPYTPEEQKKREMSIKEAYLEYDKAMLEEARKRLNQPPVKAAPPKGIVIAVQVLMPPFEILSPQPFYKWSYHLNTQRRFLTLAGESLQEAVWEWIQHGTKKSHLLCCVKLPEVKMVCIWNPKANKWTQWITLKDWLNGSDPC